MSQHAADRIIDQVIAQLQAAGLTVFVDPVGPLTDDDMPCVRISDVEDELISSIPGVPFFETHSLSFEAFCCAMVGSSGLRAAIGKMRHDVEFALLGSPTARKLGGLITRDIKRLSAKLQIDGDTLQKPVGGWSIRFECTYGLHTDAPSKVEKE